MTPVYIFIACIGAAFVQRTVGFGFGVFIMTVLPFLMPSYAEATALSGLMALTTAALVVVRSYRFITWRRLLPILLTFIVTSTVAVALLAHVEEHALRIVLGIVLILVCIYFSLFSQRIHLRPTMGTQITTGALSGLMGGFFAMQGPPAALYFIGAEPDKEHYIAMTQAYFLFGNAIMTMVRASHGFVTAAVGWGYLYGLGGALLGSWIGAKVFALIPVTALRYVIYAYIGISGIIVLLTL